MTLAAPPADRRGFALEATLIVLVLLTVLVGGALAAALIVRRTANVDYHASRVAYAAEAGADAVMAQLAGFMDDGLLTQAELDAVTTPALPPFVFDRPQVTRLGAAVPRTISSGPFAGLIGLNQAIDIGIGASDAAGNRSDVVVTVNAQAIPLFQFGVFYEEDLEIHNGPVMRFAGWVHSNANIYVTSQSQTFFEDVITTPDSLFWQRKAYPQRMNGVFIHDASGQPKLLQFDSRDYRGNPNGFVARSRQDFDGRLMTSAHKVSPLRLPLPAGLPAITLIDPRRATDDAQVRSVKFAWRADWHITVDLTRLGTVCTNGIAHDRAGRAVPDATECANIFRGIPDAFHEGREAIGADVFEIDVDRLHEWVQAAPAARGTAILYVTFTGESPTDSRRDYPVLRLTRGARLRFPMTVATDRPLYVHGDYNNVGWQPAALLGDAVTFLSNDWNDTHAGNRWNPAWNPAVTHPYSAERAAATEVYAAIAAGHSATPCDWQRPGCTVPATPPPVPATSNYGGGLENFPRFLENWNGRRMLYRGSLVSLFQSRYAARRRWNWRTYYDAPNRDWEFDLRFRDPNSLPPGTPTVGSILQTAFRPVY